MLVIKGYTLLLDFSYDLAAYLNCGGILATVLCANQS